MDKYSWYDESKFGLKDQKTAKNLHNAKTLETYEVDPGGKSGKDTVNVNFMDEEEVSNAFEQKKREKHEHQHEEEDEEKQTEEPGKEKTTDDSEERRKAADGETNSREYCDEMAAMTIDFLDAVSSTALGSFAKDKKDENYEIPEKKKIHLKKQLGIIFFKYNTVFKIELIFFFTLIASYLPLILMARRKRREETGKVIIHDFTKGREEQKRESPFKDIKTEDVEYAEVVTDDEYFSKKNFPEDKYVYEDGKLQFNKDRTPKKRPGAPRSKAANQ
jgi:hypothetical protein